MNKKLLILIITIITNCTAVAYDSAKDSIDAENEKNGSKPFCDYLKLNYFTGRTTSTGFVSSYLQMSASVDTKKYTNQDCLLILTAFPYTPPGIDNEIPTYSFDTGLPSGWSGTWTIDSSSINCYSNSCLKSGSIGNSASTITSLYATTSSGSISFYRKVSSEMSYDYCKFSIDGVSQDGSGDSGSINWTKYRYSISSGTHVFSWTYLKDSGGTSGSDACWIDNITLPTNSTTVSGGATCSSATALTYNVSRTGSVSTGSYVYYTFTASISSSYTVVVTANTGDPDLYMTKNGSGCPTASTSSYSSTVSGSESYPIVLSSGDVLTIGVYGYSSSSYT
ncbi:MAG TPA: hypothetical protein PKK42_17495, partial [Leptospiraceae bacterium]|nr:hypothetical protein [Leptospiraceae bacterium]